jgi:two-component system sensor histidine kinase PilS (NtrC family)
MPGSEATSGGPVPAEAVGLLPATWRSDPVRRKLAWVILFRLVLDTVLLGGTAFWQVGAGSATPALATALYAIVLATFVASLAFAAWLATGRWLAALAWAQIATDVAIATAVVAITGWSDSVFVFMYSLAIVEGAILLFRVGAVGALALSLATYVSTILWLAPGRSAVLSLFAHAGAFVASGALATYLAEQLRRTGEKLEARESDLAAVTALQEAIVQSVAAGLVTLDSEGRITFLNRAGEQITGLRAEDVRGEPAALWFSGMQEQTGRDETDFENVRGERLRLGYTHFALRGRDGTPIGRAVIFQDLSGLRDMEERVQRSERLADIGRVAAGLAHELRNPIAAMSGSIELLRAGIALSPDEARLMDIVTREAARLNELVTRFLEYARPAVPRRRLTDLARLASDTLEVFANDPAASSIRIEGELSQAECKCDPDLMRQVLWNLLANAAHAARWHNVGSAGRGRVTVRTALDADGWARLEVEDDGAGIPPQDLQRLFTPFFTTKERGSGLGLATVQRVVDAHHGTIVAGSGSDGGARFVVRLPREG